MVVVIGLDLSLTGLGLVAVPGDWGLDFSRVQRETLQTGPRAAQVDRRAMLADDVVRWVDWARGKNQVEVWIEGSITGRQYANTVRSQLMLAGVVAHELRRRLNIDASFAEQSTARRLLLGRLPPRNRKAYVLAELRKRTATQWREDEYDAFVTANYGLLQAGLAFYAVPGLLERARPARRRKLRRAA